MTTRQLLTTAAALAALAGGTTATFAAAQSTAPAAPRIADVEVDDDAPAGKLRLETEVRARGAAVTSVRFTYRGRTFKGVRSSTDRNEWFRVVTARSADLRDDARITVKVKACAGERCSTRTVTDDA